VTGYSAEPALAAPKPADSTYGSAPISKPKPASKPAPQPAKPYTAPSEKLSPATGLVAEPFARPHQEAPKPIQSTKPSDSYNISTAQAKPATPIKSPTTHKSPTKAESPKAIPSKESALKHPHYSQGFHSASGESDAPEKGDGSKNPEEENKDDECEG